MTPEAVFLEAIKADPHDATTRLVYADWLEKRGDPRAELIRIEEEMRPLPVFSDRFWQLKPRRYELLQKLPKDWLETMRYGTDCPPTFRHQPGSVKDWWRLIRVFFERWHGHASIADVGGQHGMVKETENHFGVRLPPSLREWVAFACDFPRTNERFHTLQRPQLNVLNDIPGFWIATEDLSALVRKVDMGIEDPPVYAFDHDPEKVNPNLPLVMQPHLFIILPHIERLSWFALDYLVDYPIRSSGLLRTQADGPQLACLLTQQCPVRFYFGTAEIFETANLLIKIVHRTPVAQVTIAVHDPVRLGGLPNYVLEIARETPEYARFGVFRSLELAS